MRATNVVFDIGGVLVDWFAHLAWADKLGSPQAAKEFMARVNFKERNARADGGVPFAQLASEVAAPEDAALVAEYPALFQKTVPSKISGTWDILAQLQARKIPLHAITNWSAETWPEGLKAHPQLGEVFETLVVSGREGMIKPDRRIFELFCARAGVAAQACIFIDDSLPNVTSARGIGMDAVHFTDSAQLETDLTARGLL
ncbi:MAG: HAD family phosphatase [Sulfitobacter sp.]